MLGLWAAVNSVVIMFALGLSPVQRKDRHWYSWPMLRALLVYNFLVPALALAGAVAMDWLEPAVVTGLGLCIAAAGGTSGGAFTIAAGGKSRDAAVLILALGGLSLSAMSGLAWLGLIILGDFSPLSLAGYLLGITLAPLWLGRAAQARFPSWSQRLKPVAETLGSGLVILLVTVLAGRYGVDVLAGPAEPLLAGALLVATLLLAPLLEEPGPWRRTVLMVNLIRNLSLVLALVVLLPDAELVLPTVLAFGLMMYLAAGVLLWRWRSH